MFKKNNFNKDEIGIFRGNFIFLLLCCNPMETEAKQSFQRMQPQP